MADNLLRQYFPMLPTRMELRDRIEKRPELRAIFYRNIILYRLTSSVKTYTIKVSGQNWMHGLYFLPVMNRKGSAN